MTRELIKILASLGLAWAAAAGPTVANELFLYNWSNYTSPELLKKFEAETGIRVRLDIYDSNETLLAKLQAGATGYDVIVPSDYMAAVMIRNGLLERINARSLPNFANVALIFASPPFDRDREYTAPYMWGTTGFTYDSARVPEGWLEESWRPFFEPPPELVGQIAVMNDEVEVWNAAAYYLGVPTCSAEPEDGRRILELLERQKPAVANYNSSGSIERLAAGEVILHHQWNGAAHRTKQQLPSAIYVYPKEGLTLWMDNFAVPKGAPHLEEAKTFINWMLEPRNIAAASNFTGYNNAIPAASEFLDSALREDIAVVAPKEFEARFRPVQDCSDEARALRNRVWTRLKR
jgi:spermidine/putrescine transport system substrate-binding protein